MFMLNRNLYEVEEYKKIEDSIIELTPMQFAIVEMLANNKLVSYKDIIKHVKKCCDKELTYESLKVSIYRIRKKGINIHCNNFSEYCLGGEWWIN